MPADFNERTRMFGGGVRWTAQSTEICVEGSPTDGFRARARLPGDKPLVTGRVLPPGRVKFLVRDEHDLSLAVREYHGHTFTGVSQHGTRAIAAYIETRLLRKLRPGSEAIPAEVALAHLSLWADSNEECIGLYWSDGFEVLRVVTKGSALWLFEDDEIAPIAHQVPWVDHSDPGVGGHFDGEANRIDGSCGYTGGAALAVGAATSAGHECGGFVNPKPQSVMRDGVLTMTMPNRQVSTP